MAQTTPTHDRTARPNGGRRRARRALLAALALAPLIVGAGWWARLELAVRADASEARRLVAAGKYAEARAPLERWLKARPDSAEAAFLGAKGLFAFNLFEDGFRALGRAETLGHDPDAVARLRAITLAKLGQHDQAIPTLRRLLDASDAPDPEASEALARAYLETFQLHAAGTAIERWIREAPENPKAYLWRVQLGLRTKVGPEEIARDYREAIRVDPGCDEARVGLAEILIDEHKFEEARQLYEAVVARKPDDAAAELGLGLTLAGLGDEDGAIRHLERAAELAPRNVKPRIERARIDQRRGRYEAALAWLDRAVEADPSDPDARYNRGLVLTRLGREDEARADRDRATQLRKDHETLSQLLTDLFNRPGDTQLQYDSALWLFEHGHPEEGLRWAEKVLKARPDHPETNRLLADYYEKAGNHGLANYHRLQAGGARSSKTSSP